ncbi:MAG: DUF547 domain-containing protein [Flavobacteriaceae bacterium]|nr:DUF547 domain-containing protein [Flavobacteriaceae bacterium]
MKTLLITLLISLGLTNSEINFQQDQNQDKGIHASWNVLLQQYVDADGNVDYHSWKKSQTDLDKYIQLLEKTPPANYWDKNDSLAYFINAYNAVTVKLILDNYPLKSIRDIKDPWDSKSLNLPNNRLTLNDIEHKVLRKMDDPRIHFAINCASASCPQLSNEAFRASKVQKQLEETTALFINDTSKNQISKKNIGLSKIFLWFSKDFGSKKERIAFIQKYSQKPFKDNAKIKYQEYDWSLNE